MGRGAASVDYFMILAIVVLVILVAVGLMYGVPKLEETRFIQSSNYWQYAAAPFGILEHNAGPGIFVMVAQNTGKERMKFKKLFLDGREQALVGGGSLFGFESLFKAGMRKKMVFQSNFACPPGEFYEHQVLIQYEDALGTPHEQTGAIKVYGRCIENPDTGCVECNGRLCCYPAICDGNGMCTTCGNLVCERNEGYPANETCYGCIDCLCNSSCQTCNGQTGLCDTTQGVLGSPCQTSFDCCVGSGLECYGGRCTDLQACILSGLSCNGNSTSCCSFTCVGGNCCQPAGYNCNATLPCCSGSFCNSALHCQPCPAEPGGPCNTSAECCLGTTGWSCLSNHTCGVGCGNYEGAYCDQYIDCCPDLGLTCDLWNRVCVGGVPDLLVAVSAPASWQSGQLASVSINGTNIGAGRFNRDEAVFGIHARVGEGEGQAVTDNAMIEPNAGKVWNVLSVCNALGENETLYNITGGADDANTTGYTPVVAETTKANNIALREISCRCNEFGANCTVDGDCCERASCIGNICTYPGLPDLVANGSLAELSQIRQAGVPFMVYVSTRNIWSGDANLSTQTQVRIDGSLATTLDIPPLASDESNLQDIMIACPSAGLHNFTLVADAGSVINETNEANNNWSYEINCVGGVDLLASSPDAPPSILYGQQVPIQILTRNIGNASSGALSLTRVMWNGNAIANLTVPVLAGSGGSNLQTVSISCDAPGQKMLIVGADANFTIPEENETNNNATYPIVCICPSCGFSAQQLFDAGQQSWLPYLSFDINVTAAPNTSLTALWITNQHLDDYGQIYLNGVWVLNDSRPGPMTLPLCNNFYNAGPYYLNSSSLNMSYGATNFLHLDNVDYCWGLVQVDFTLNYNISVIPPAGETCTCPPSPAGLLAFSPLYHRTSCTVSTELGTECPSGICSWDSPQKACISCSIFPALCQSDGECCNNKCQNYNGTAIKRCVYSPHKSNAGCNWAGYASKDGLCAPLCQTDANCPWPLVCTSVGLGNESSVKGCRLPCTAGSQCGIYTTVCSSNFCRY